MKKVKRSIVVFLSLLIAFSAISTQFLATSSPSNNVPSEWEEEFEILYSRGLTTQNIKSLANQGLFPDEQVLLTDAQLHEYLGDTFGQSISAPLSRASTVTVQNVPDDLFGTSTEIFLAGCGMYNGDFYADNSGSSIVSCINQFTNHVFSGASCYKFYFLYGEYDPSIGYHKGVDIKAKSGLPQIKSANSGTAVLRPDFGAVCVQGDGYTHSYLHMDPIAVSEMAPISVGTVLGTEGAEKAPGPHLHYEVRAGASSSLGDNSATNQNTSPYYHMIKSL